MNKGKGTYTKAKQAYAKSPKMRKYYAEYAKKNSWKYSDRIKSYWNEYTRGLGRKYSYYKSNAKKRGLYFLLSLSEF